MRILLKPLSAVALSLAIVASLEGAQEPITVLLSVVDIEGQPVPGVQVTTTGRGPESHLTTDAGKTRIKVDPRLEAGSSVSLKLLPSDQWILLNYRIIVPSSEETEPVQLILMRRSDFRAVLAGAVSEVSRRRSVEEEFSEAQRQRIIEEYFIRNGVSREYFETAIASFRETASDPFDRGLADLAAGNYLGADSKLEVSYSLRKQRWKNALEGFREAEEDLSEVILLWGETLLVRGNYPAADSLFREGLRLRPKDPRLMSWLGLVLLKRGEYHEANVILTGAIAIWVDQRGEDEHSGTLTAMSYLALTLYAQGEFGAAHDMAERVVEVRHRVLGPGHPDTLTAINNLARILSALGKLADAKALHDHAYGNLKSTLGPKHPETLTAMSYLAQALYAQGNLADASVLGAKVLENRREILGLDHPDIFTAMNNLARILRSQGDLMGAKELHEQALVSLHSTLGAEHPDTLTAMSNLAQTLFARGDYSRARELEENVLSARIRILGNEHPATLNAINNLSQILKSQGWFSEAKELNEQALAIQQRILGKEHPDTLSTMSSLAQILYRQGRLARSRDMEEVLVNLRLRVLGPDHPATLSSMINLAQVLKAMGGLQVARELEEQALEAMIRVLGKKHPATLASMHKLAGTLYGQGDIIAAQKIYQDVIEIRGEIYGDGDELGTLDEAATFYELGRSYQDSQELDKAMDHFYLALDALESQIEKAGVTSENKSVFRAEYTNYYYEAINVSLSLGRSEDALCILERSRAQGLLGLLGESSYIGGDIPEELQNTRNLNAVRYDYLLAEKYRLDLAGQVDRGRYVGVEEELVGIRREREMIRSKILQAVSLKDTIERPKPLGLREVREALDPGTVMLYYRVGEGDSDLFVLSRSEVLKIYRLPLGREELSQQVVRFNDLLRFSEADLFDSSSTARLRLGHWLFEKLIRPAEDAIESSSRLLVVPDGPLQYLSFAALSRESKASKNGWQYLIEWKPIHVSASAAIYSEIRKQRMVKQTDIVTRAQQLVAFGDPAYSVSMPPSRPAARQGLLDNLTPLPSTRSEVNQIARLFPNGSARIYIGKEATEERAKAEIGEAKIVHFAVHSVLDPVVPGDSFLALSSPALSEGRRENGLLQTWEIVDQLRLSADLVVLSTCQGAIGPERRGEGLISLARAFQAAGARTVVGALWDLPDTATVELMIRFYRHLHEGETKDEALRAAQMEFIRGPVESLSETREVSTMDFSAPYYWAAFQLFGDWQWMMPVKWSIVEASADDPRRLRVTKTEYYLDVESSAGTVATSSSSYDQSSLPVPLFRYGETWGSDDFQLNLTNLAPRIAISFEVKDPGPYREYSLGIIDKATMEEISRVDDLIVLGCCLNLKLPTEVFEPGQYEFIIYGSDGSRVARLNSGYDLKIEIPRR